MNRYSAERKASVIQKMMPPHNIPIPRLAEETGISDVTLYYWRKQARVEGIAVPADGKNEAELAEYCRRKGLYAEQIEAWHKACLQANADSATQARAQREQTKKDRKQIKKLERELHRKEKACPKRPPCWCSKKKPRRAGETARTNDLPCCRVDRRGRYRRCATA